MRFANTDCEIAGTPFVCPAGLQVLKSAIPPVVGQAARNGDYKSPDSYRDWKQKNNYGYSRTDNAKAW